MEADRKRSKVNPAVGLREKLSRIEILRGKKNFAFLYERGTRIEGKFLSCYTAVLHFFPAVTVKHYFAVNVYRKIGSACYRNKIKRWIREAYRRKRIALFRYEDAEKQTENARAVLFIYGKRKIHVKPGYTEIEQDVHQIIDSIVMMKSNQS